MRVHELAKELGVTSKELLAALADMGVTGKSASSSVPEDMVPRLRASGGKATTAPAKPREVLEPPPQPRKPRAKPKPKPAAVAAVPAQPVAVAGTPAAAPAVPEPKQPPKQRRRPEPAAPGTPADDRREARPVARRDREDPVHGGRHGNRDDVAHRRATRARRHRARLHRGDRRARG